MAVTTIRFPGAERGVVGQDRSGAGVRKPWGNKEGRPFGRRGRCPEEDSRRGGPCGGHLGKAIDHATGQGERMIRYLDDGILRPDNSRAGNAIRPFCVGRSNSLFSGGPRGASATIYTLVESAKANKLEPYHCMHHVFRRLPAVMSEAELVALLPTNLTPAQVAPQA